MTNYKIQRFPKSRIATIDICEIGIRKHQVTGLIELDVSESRQKIREYNKRNVNKISFLAWIISVIGCTLKEYGNISSYYQKKNKLIVFHNINVSVVVEKDLKGQKIPIPLLIERVNEISIEEIAKQINDAKKKQLTDHEIVLQKKTSRLERIYYYVPGFIRRYIWKLLLRHPKLAFKKMGNVAITSIGMFGQIKGWFIPISIHPVCFGLSSIIKKPIVIENRIVIGEILSMSILFDHDVVDGAPMARFVCELSKNIEKGFNL